MERRCVDSGNDKAGDTELEGTTAINRGKWNQLVKTMSRQKRLLIGKRTAIPVQCSTAKWNHKSCSVHFYINVQPNTNNKHYCYSIIKLLLLLLCMLLLLL